MLANHRKDPKALALMDSELTAKFGDTVDLFEIDTPLAIIIAKIPDLPSMSNDELLRKLSGFLPNADVVEGIVIYSIEDILDFKEAPYSRRL